MLRVSEAAAASGGQLIFPEYMDESDKNIISNTFIQGTVMDNRLVRKDYLFIPFIGEKVDAHKFIPEAYESGAVICFSMRPLDINHPYILVEDSKTALKNLAAYYRSTLDIPIIGIVGSVGKTSTKEMVYSVLSEKYNVLKTEGNFNNEIGLPLTIMRIRPEHQAAVVEMGISDFGEMDRLAAIAKPNYLIMTNIGPCHLEFLHDLDGVLYAKTESFKHLSSHARIILNGDDEKLSQIKHGIPDGNYHAVPDDADIFYFIRHNITLTDKSELPPAACARDVINLGLGGIDCTIGLLGEDINVHISLPGEHNVNNAMAAAIVAECLGLNAEQIRSGISNGNTISGRSNVIKLKDVLIIDDCYNAGPVSMKASLEVLGSAPGRKIAVLGDMGELGENAPELHRSVAQSVLDNKIDIVFTAGVLSKEIHNIATNSGIESQHFANIDDLCSVLLTEIKAGDTILIKASHFMNFSMIVQKLVERYK